MIKFEKILLGSGLVIATISFIVIAHSHAQRIQMMESASPASLEHCSAISNRRTVRFSENQKISVMEECLIKTDPAYKVARFNDMCNKAKENGLVAEKFSEEFQSSCFKVKTTPNSYDHQK